MILSVSGLHLTAADLWCISSFVSDKASFQMIIPRMRLLMCGFTELMSKVARIAMRSGRNIWASALDHDLRQVSDRSVKLMPTHFHRCVGLLHSCQTWLELQDGQENHILITAPEDDEKYLIDKNVTLPKSGSQIGIPVWSVLQDACRYGLADLRKCDKPGQSPRCVLCV